MNNQPMVIDDTWYRRLPAAKERIAAGGIVLRQEDQRVYVALARELALVREADVPPFVLPKGEVEPDETLEAAARREILEEVGLSDLQLIGQLGVLERLSYNKTIGHRPTIFSLRRLKKRGYRPTPSTMTLYGGFPLMISQPCSGRNNGG